MYFTNQLSTEHVRYPAVIINCPEEEIETTDIKTRKFLTMQDVVHPTSSTLRPCMNRGVLSIRDIILAGTAMISEYTIRDMLLSEYLRQQPPPPRPRRRIAGSIERVQAHTPHVPLPRYARSEVIFDRHDHRGGVTPADPQGQGHVKSLSNRGQCCD